MAEYSEFRAALLRVKGGREQRDFLESVRDDEGSGFLERVGRIPVTEGEELRPLGISLSENEFVNPPFQTEERMYQRWGKLTPDVASSSAFWAYVTIQHLKLGKVWASYLASSGNGNQSGQERIERALESREDTGAKQMDDCVRTIFRQMGGLPEVRGNRSVFVDCPLARGWWRQRLVSRAAERRADLRADIVGRAIRESKTHWEKLVSAMVSRNPVFGFEHVQDALLAGLAPLVEDSNGSSARRITSQHIQDICQRSCFTGGSKELGILEYDEISECIRIIVHQFFPDMATER